MVEQYIFESGTEDDFYDFLDSFHELFVSDLVVTGSGSNDKSLEQIKMVTVDHTDEYARDVLNSIKGLLPTIHIHYRDVVKCNLYSVDNERVKGVFLLQQIIGYPKRGCSMYSVWRCGKQQMDTETMVILFNA